MEVECLVELCYKYHDAENEAINQKAKELADSLQDVLSYRNTFCNCSVEKYSVIIPAERTQKLNLRVIAGCPHFNEQLVKASHYVKNMFRMN